MLRRLAFATPLIVLAACAHASDHGHAHEVMKAASELADTASATEKVSAAATIIGGTGGEIGSASFVQGPHGMLIRMEIAPGGLTPGWHGLHLHETGDCSDVGTFQLSGGHHGKEPGRHGLMNPDGSEAGDLPNIWAAADGSAGYEAFTTLTQLAPALEGEGISIIIHASEDDHFSQPIGGAGARVACGVITRISP